MLALILPQIYKAVDQIARHLIPVDWQCNTCSQKQILGQNIAKSQLYYSLLWKSPSFPRGTFAKSKSQ